MSRKRIYVAYTGGTIGMQHSDQGYVPVPGFLTDTVKRMPEFYRAEMPEFDIHEYHPVIDSSDMTPEHWRHIAEDIQQQYHNYDGFVVLHGTDTIGALCAPGGRLYEARRAVIESCAASPHLSLHAPAGALYAFPAVCGAAAEGFDDHAFALELLETEDVLVVPGSSFNLAERNRFRVTLLPEPAQVREVFGRIHRVLERRAAAVRDTDDHVAVA